MVIIRLARKGAKKRPFYHLVVTDHRKRRDSGAIESIGYYNPIAAGKDVRLLIDMERLAHWQKVGAQLSDRVRALCKDYQAEQAKAHAA